MREGGSCARAHSKVRCMVSGAFAGLATLDHVTLDHVLASHAPFCSDEDILGKIELK